MEVVREEELLGGSAGMGEPGVQGGRVSIG